VPRQRHQKVPAATHRRTTIPVDRSRRVRNKEPKGNARKRSISLIGTKCDELFPPSRPEFRIRNQACHQIYG
jgi:hypothetical protein